MDIVDQLPSALLSELRSLRQATQAVTAYRGASFTESEDAAILLAHVQDGTPLRCISLANRPVEAAKSRWWQKLKHLKNLHLLLSVHEDASEHSERQRDAVYGRELLGLSIEVPWSAWEGFEAGTGFETGMVFEYYAQVPGRFVVRFLPDSDCEDIGMSWAELLGEQCCLASTSEKAVLLHTLQSQLLTLQPRGQPPKNTVWDQRKAAWIRSDGMQHNDVSLDSTLALHVRICIL